MQLKPTCKQRKKKKRKEFGISRSTFFQWRLKKQWKVRKWSSKEKCHFGSKFASVLFSLTPNLWSFFSGHSWPSGGTFNTLPCSSLPFLNVSDKIFLHPILLLSALHPLLASSPSLDTVTPTHHLCRPHVEARRPQPSLFPVHLCPPSEPHFSACPQNHFALQYKEN